MAPHLVQTFNAVAVFRCPAESPPSIPPPLDPSIHLPARIELCISGNVSPIDQRIELHRDVMIHVPENVAIV